MRKQRTLFTVDEHVECGAGLKAARDASVFRLLNYFYKSSRAGQALRRVDKALLTLRSTLDDELLRLVPREKDPRNLATRVYFGDARFVRRTPTGNRHDAFDNWEAEPVDLFGGRP